MKKLAIVFLCFLTAIFCSFVVAACNTKSEPYYGTYYCGYQEGEEPNKIVIGKTYKDSGGEYDYDYENGVMYVNGVTVVFAENFEVHYLAEAKIWSYDAGKAGCSNINVRNGYLNDSLYVLNALFEMQERYNFMPDGTYEHYKFDDNMLPDIESGTYTLNSGVLTLNQTSYTAGLLTQDQKTHRYWYISEDLDIYGGVYLKNPEKFTYMPEIPETPETPNTPPAAQKFTLSYAAGAGGRIIGTLTQSVESGKDGASVIAVADEDYEFIGWSDGVETAERQDTNVTEDITVTAQFEFKNSLFAGGAGTQTRPYRIANSEQLKIIQKYPNAHFMLDNDIVFDESTTESNFTPMFSDDNMFNGSLDGNGHKITNLTINNTSTFYTGLFACIGEKGAVKNLTLENVNISGTNYIGSIAGYSLGVIENCSVSGNIKYLSQNTYKVFVGGMVGKIENKIEKCSTDVNVVCSELNGETYIGGIAGYFYDEKYNAENLFSISKCYALGDIVCDSANSDVTVGGLFGYALSVSYDNVYSVGDITVSNSSSARVGGLVGDGWSTINNSYTSGNVTATSKSYGASYCGGLVGYAGGAISNSYTTGNVTATSGEYGSSCCGGLVGYGGGDAISNSYTTGNVTANATRIIAGGLVGYTNSGYGEISNSYTMGNVTVTSSSGEATCGGLLGYTDFSYDYKLNITGSYTIGNITATGLIKATCGGLVGGSYYLNITNSYTKGNLTATVTGKAPDAVFRNYCGGFTGVDGGKITIVSSYTVSKIKTVCKGENENYSGAFVGYTNSFTLTNAHWLYYAESGVEYAVGYGSSMGIPSSIGATKHTELSDFYTLAETLNNGLEDPVWENLGENALPTLKKKGEEQN